MLLTDTGRDLATVVVKDFDESKLPENFAFSYWIDNATGTKYKPGDEMRLLNGADVSMVPVFNLSFDFSSLETAYKLPSLPERQPEEDEVASGYRLLEAAGRKRGMLISGGEVDTERMSRVLL